MGRQSALSEFQLAKLRDYFHCMDANGSGSLDWDDFKRVADRVAAQLGWSENQPAYKWLHSRRLSMWKNMLRSMDLNQDGVISFQELVSFFQTLADAVEDSGEVPRSAEGHVLSLLIALDTDGSGDISADELASYYRAIGSDADANTVFSELDLDGDGRLSLDDVEQLWVEWVTADAPGAPGNLLVTGRLP